MSRTNIYLFIFLISIYFINTAYAAQLYIYTNATNTSIFDGNINAMEKYVEVSFVHVIDEDDGIPNSISQISTTVTAYNMINEGDCTQIIYITTSNNEYLLKYTDPVTEIYYSGSNYLEVTSNIDLSSINIDGNINQIENIIICNISSTNNPLENTNYYTTITTKLDTTKQYFSTNDTNYILAPNLELEINDWFENDVFWYPYVYVGETANISATIKNIANATNSGVAFDVSKNLASNNPSAIAVYCPSNIIGDVYKDAVIYDERTFCEITANQEGFAEIRYNISDYTFTYNATNSTVLYAVYPESFAYFNKTYHVFGDQDAIIMNIRKNASDIKNITVTITYENITSTNDGTETITKTYSLTENPKYFEYLNGSFVYDEVLGFEVFESNIAFKTWFNTSGVYNYYISIEFENTTLLPLTENLWEEIETGNLKVYAKYPGYRILENQTGNITLVLEAFEGDIWDLTITSITSSDNQTLKINDYYSLRNYYFNNKTKYVYAINITSNKTGVVALTIQYNVSDIYGNTNTYEETVYYEIIKPKINISQTLYNITEIAEIQTFIVGNLSPILFIQSLTNATILHEKSIEIPIYLTTTTENVCYSDELQQNTNLAKNATITNITNIAYENYSIDGNYETYTTFKTYLGEGNITLDLGGEYLVNKIAIYGYGDSDNEEIHIYYEKEGIFYEYVDTQQNTYLLSNTTIAYTNITIKDIQEVQNITISILGSSLAYIHEIEIFATTRSSEAPCHIYTLYKYINRSGKHEIYQNIFFEYNTTHAYGTFDVNFGQIEIRFCSEYNSGTGNIFIANSNKTLKYIHLLPVGGDVVNVTLNISLNDTSIIDIQYGENSTKQIPYLSYIEDNIYTASREVCSGEGRLIEYNLTTYTVLNKTEISLEVNATTALQNITNKSNIYVYPVDNETANLTSWWFGYWDGISTIKNYTKTNINMPLYIVFNATDNIAIIGARINISYENYTVSYEDNNLIKIYGTYSNGTFQATIPKELINISETVNITLEVLDFSGNYSTNNETKNITITTNIYPYILKDASIYNLGEYFTITFKDEKGILHQEPYNLSIITTNSTNTTYVLCEESNGYVSCNETHYVFVFDGIRRNIYVKDKPETYTDQYYLEYKNNTGKLTKTYSISNQFDGEIQTFRDENDNIILINVYAYYKNKLEDLTTLEGYVKCNDETYALINIEPNLFRHLPPTISCEIPATIIVNASYNNNILYLTKTINPTTTTTTTSSSGGGGSGGGGGGFSGYIPTNITEKIIKEFNINVYPLVIDIEQHKSDKFYINYENKGNTPLNITITIETNCNECKLNHTIYQLKDISPGEGNTLENEIYVPLKQKEGTYEIKVIAKEQNITKINKIALKVKTNPLLIEEKSLQESYEKIIEKIKEYKKIGIELNDEEYIKEIENLFEENKELVNKDNITQLSQNLEKINENIERLQELLNNKQTEYLILKNKDKIITYGLVALIISIISISYIIPLIFMNLRRSMLKHKLKIIINTRIETEKQYFMRKIDDITFRRIMEKEQDNLIKTKQEIAKLDKEIYLLARLKYLELFKFRKEFEKIKKEEKSKKPSPPTPYKERAPLWHKIKQIFSRKNKLNENEKILLKNHILTPKKVVLDEKNKS